MIFLSRASGAPPLARRFRCTSALSLLTLSLGLSPQAVAAVPPAERAALVDLYHSTQGDQWISKQNWLNGDPCENQWHGIFCNPGNDRVTSVMLSSNQLKGPIPASFTQLKNLEQIGLSFNSLNGPIFDIAQLKKLRSFWAMYSFMEGNFPDITGLSQLEEFNAVMNRLHGKIPDISRMHSLKHFSIGGEVGRLEGSLPDISAMTWLEHFSVSDSALTGSIPDISRLTNLQSFHVSNSGVTGHIPDISKLVNLTSFSVRGNKLTGPIPDISGLVKLTVFSVGGNFLTGSAPIPPATLLADRSSLCPNFLNAVPGPNDVQWNAATGQAPWWGTACTPTLTVQASNATGSGGTVSPASQTVQYGGTARFTITPDATHVPRIGGGCGRESGVLNGNQYEIRDLRLWNISRLWDTTNCTLNVEFVALPGGQALTIPEGPQSGQPLKLALLPAIGLWNVKEAATQTVAAAVASNAVAPLPGDMDLPYGVVKLKLERSSVAGTEAKVTLTYPTPFPADTVYYKYGPTPSNPAPHWYEFPHAVVEGNTITLTLTDGELGDSDLAANGTIVDPGGPALKKSASSVTAVPTLSSLALWMLAGSLGALATFMRRQKY